MKRTGNPGKKAVNKKGGVTSASSQNPCPFSKVRKKEKEGNWKGQANWHENPTEGREIRWILRQGAVLTLTRKRQGPCASKAALFFVFGEFLVTVSSPLTLVVVSMSAVISFHVFDFGEVGGQLGSERTLHLRFLQCLQCLHFIPYSYPSHRHRAPSCTEIRSPPLSRICFFFWDRAS